MRFGEFLPDTQQIGAGVIVGQNGWEAVLERNKVAFIDQFVTRKRFTDMYPATMVPTLYVGSIEPECRKPVITAELAQLGSILDREGRPPQGSAMRKSPNIEPGQLGIQSGLPADAVLGYLRRNPNDAPDTDYTGYDFWLSKLNSFTSPGDDVLVRVQKAEMVRAFIVSKYRADWTRNLCAVKTTEAAIMRWPFFVDARLVQVPYGLLRLLA